MNQPFVECPRCGCKFDSLKFYTIPELAYALQRSLKTVQSWITAGRLGYRVRPLNGFTSERIIGVHHLMAFLDRYWPNPLDDPDGNSLAHKLWRRARDQSRKGAEASRLARAAKRLAKQ